ncbi:hypothetical protein GBAR_LOCUS22485 [Geodia barretti]|nr:hypothetical protein GBAR_LOCUS22485 [Geodia barretti]
MKNHWKQLFARVKEGYNEYVELIGRSIGIGACAAVQRGNAIYTIEDHTPLLHFLSDGEDEAGNDWLFIVIADIITAHNAMLDLPRQLASQPFIRLLPNKQTEAFPNEITATHSIVPQSENPHGITELLQLIRSRQRSVFHPQPSSTSVLQDVTMPNSFSSTVPLFHLAMLQEDIITRFIAGKPFIRDLSTLRTPFQFKMSAPKHQLYKRSVISSDELAYMKTSLGELTENMDEGLLKHLELVFHAAGYHTILYTTTGLKTVAGYLVKPVGDVGGAFNNTWTFREYLQSLYDGHRSVTEALSEIGMRQLTESQVTCLLDIPLANLYHCLEVFSNWMEKCVYDFSSLPYTLKSHLEPSDLSTLKALPLTWKEPMTELLNEANALNEQLSRAEVSITNQNTGQSIIAYLKELNVICNDDQLPNYIPNTILIRHYVQLRIVLREILREVQQKIDQEVEENGTSEWDSQQWDDRVEDIWEKHLPKFRGLQYTEDGPFLYDAAKGRYQYEIESEEDELIDSKEMGDIEEEEGGVGGANGNQMRSRIELKEGETCESVVVGGGEGETESVNGSQKENEKAGQQMAAKATPEQVAEFITTIGFGQYAKFFLDDEMDGEMMLDAKDSDLPDQVDSRLHQVKIIALFRSTFTGTKKTSLSVDDVGCFLKAEKLDKFVDIFKDNAIDGDILEAILERSDVVDGTGGMTSS